LLRFPQEIGLVRRDNINQSRPLLFSGAQNKIQITFKRRQAEMFQPFTDTPFQENLFAKLQMNSALPVDQFAELPEDIVRHPQ